MLSGTAASGVAAVVHRRRRSAAAPLSGSAASGVAAVVHRRRRSSSVPFSNRSGNDKHDRSYTETWKQNVNCEVDPNRHTYTY